MCWNWCQKSVKIAKPEAIVLDLESTLVERYWSSKKLFPALRNNINDFLNKTFDSPTTKLLIKLLRNEKCAGIPPIADSDDQQPVVQSAEANILWQMDNKLSTISLKTAHLLCWVYICENDILLANIYKDVSYALHEWKVRSKIKLFVYSRANICAQKLLLVKTNHGNIYHLIDDFFDATIGPKNNIQTYRSISDKIDVKVENIVYITDNPKEAISAYNSGFKSILIKRPNSKYDVQNQGLPVIKSFSDISFN
ncbi:uncharacterized protein LOC128965548 [Oppia nitens]|uniref:uncharacterized protein LOC128965548 n=1 Tax=Oppia nitens TaxID=1686743 RepID=UPI0023DB1CA1|nr:uncharacterized protein LOC128965548 [Oppia nitens]